MIGDPVIPCLWILCALTIKLFFGFINFDQYMWSREKNPCLGLVKSLRNSDESSDLLVFLAIHENFLRF